MAQHPQYRDLSVDNNRQQALTRAMALQGSRDFQSSSVSNDYSDPRLMAISFALQLLGDYKKLINVAGTLTELFEANAITYRQVRTPNDLMRRSRSVLMLLRDSDGIPLVVHSRGGVRQIYDPMQAEGSQRLLVQPECKPFGFELYPSWPNEVRAWPQLLAFAFKGNLIPLLAVLVSALVVALFNLSIPTLTAYLTTTVLPLAQTRLIVETSLAVLLVAIATLVAQLFSSLAMVRLESLLNLRVESALWTHLLRLPLAFFSRFGTADLITRVSSIGEMRQLLSSGLLSAALGLLFSLSNLVLMITYHSQLALVAGLFSAFSALVMAVLVWQNAKLESPLQQGQAEVNNLGLQAVIGMAQIRVGGNEPFIFARWFRDVASLAYLQRTGEIYSNALEILSRVLNPLGQAVIFGVFMVLLDRSRQASTGAITSSPGAQLSMASNQLVASFVSFQAAYISFNSQLSSLATQMASTVARLVVLWKRSELVMYAQAEPGNDHGNERLILEGNYSIQGLEVCYPGSNEPILSDINLSIETGTYTAITGASGCGKTTLLRCILRLIEPTAGAINVDGYDLRQLAIRSYRRQLGVVLQNTPLPSGSIYEIVKAGRPYSREEVWDSLANAAIADDIKAMSMQLETVITEGTGTISGGQRQRIALARALVGRPRVLLLDEATSALDAPTQAAISRTLEELTITRIAIAHRISTIESANQIAVIKNGVVAEIGTYNELISKPSGYLVRSINKAL